MDLNEAHSGSVTIREFIDNIKKTNRLKPQELEPLLFGLYGEVGGIMTAAKKVVREEAAFPEHLKTAEEEFGDALWYLGAICEHQGIDLERIFENVISLQPADRRLVASDWGAAAIAAISTPRVGGSANEALFALGEEATKLLRVRNDVEAVTPILERFVANYLRAMNSSGLTAANVLRRNIRKTSRAFCIPDNSTLEDFDSGFDPEERIPLNFSIDISVRKSGRSYLKWNGVFIGDPLDDAIRDPDGYRFHDVFHLGFAAILHWSPVFRALIKQKRKSDVKFDGPQDGGRAVVIEEGLSAWLFARAKELNYFRGHKKVSLDILKTIEQFVAGFEVERVPLKLWERAILESYTVFNQVRESNGGTVIGDRVNRTLRYIASQPEQLTLE